MPSGMFIRRRSENNFVKEYPSVATEWLADLEQHENISIQHARNKGEFPVGPNLLPVDGYCL